jgi:cytoskeletal protein CcmA (bactofilin family)
MKLKTFNLTLIVILSMTLMGAQLPGELTVAAGTIYNDDITASNIDVVIYPGARVKGDVETTTGDIHLADNARVKRIITISGNVFLDKGSKVDQTIRTESGTIRVREGATATGNVITETGDIRGTGATFNKDVRNRHGNIILKTGTYVKGNVEILNRGHGDDLHPVEIYLGQGVYVKGKVTAQHTGDNVDLVINGAEVNGKINKVNIIGD